MPFVPELFSAPALVRLEDKRRLDELVAVPYFDDLMAGVAAHGEHKKRIGAADEDWPDWYAESMVRQQTGQELRA